MLKLDQGTWLVMLFERPWLDCRDLKYYKVVDRNCTVFKSAVEGRRNIIHGLGKTRF